MSDIEIPLLEAHKTETEIEANKKGITKAATRDNESLSKFSDEERVNSYFIKQAIPKIKRYLSNNLPNLIGKTRRSAISIDISSSLKEILIPCYDGILVYNNLEDPSKTKEIKISEKVLTNAIFSKNDTAAIVGCRDKKLYIIELNNLNMTILSGHDSSITMIATTPDKTFLFSISSRNEVFKWNINKKSFSEISSFGIFSQSHYDKLDVSQKMVAFLSNKGMACLFSLDGDRFGEMQYKKRLEFIKISPMEDYVILSTDDAVIILDIHMTILHEITTQQVPASLSITDKSILIGNRFGKLTFFDVIELTSMSTPTSNCSIECISYQIKNDSIYMCDIEGNLFCMKNPGADFSYKLQDIPYQLVDFSHNSKKLVYKDLMPFIQELDLNSYKSKHLIENEDWADNLLVMKDKLVLSNSQFISVVNLDTKEEESRISLDMNEETINFVIESQDCSLLAFGGKLGSLIVMNLNERAIRIKMKEHLNSLKCAVFSMDNSMVMSGSSDKTIIVWNLIENRVMNTLVGHTRAVRSLECLRDSKTLISGGKDSTIRFWDINAGYQTYLISTQQHKIVGLYAMKDYPYLLSCGNEGSITFWDLNTYEQIFSSLISPKTSRMKLSPNEDYILYTSRRDSYIINNPVKAHTIEISGPGSQKYDFMKYLDSLMTVTPLQHDKEMDKWAVMPYCFTSKHFYSFYNHYDHLQKSLNHKISFTSALSCENPLSISLKRKNYECTEVIVEKFAEIANTQPKFLSLINNDILVKLNFENFQSLSKLYDNTFIKWQEIKASKTAPCPAYDLVDTLDKHDHLDQQIKNKYFGKKKNMSLWKSCLKLNLETGSNDSSKLLISIKEAKNPQIISTLFIQSLIHFKWNQAYLVHLIHLAVFICYIATLMLGDGIDSTAAIIISFAFNILLAIYDIYQTVIDFLQMQKHKFFKHSIEISRSLLFFAYIIFWSQDILLYLVTISWINGLFFFRLYRPTMRALRYISHIICKLVPEIILIIYIILALGFIIFLQSAESSLLHSLHISTYLALKSSDFSSIPENELIITIGIIISVFILCSLIPICEEVHNKVLMDLEWDDSIEDIEMIIEYENLLIWKRKKGKSKYLVACLEKEVKKIDKLNGKINKISHRVRSELQIQLAEISKNIKESFLEEAKNVRENIDNKYQRLEDHIKKMENKYAEKPTLTNSSHSP
ncbi:unnamed protein product [Blepharisma stoltei]|uniref:Uncharacterized protein n=1 Tax=Blepharisma stoltei TaxID=1481888 RepID=A0AAU9IUF1_9CILI|nr:unnamed protein product [Blepharisma stoltei]